MRKNSQSGFTLIELLVVIAIIGFLAVVILTALGNARAKSRDTKRKQDMQNMQKALENYYTANFGYPSTNGQWRGLSVNGQANCSPACTNSGATGWIPNLAPTFLQALPADPKGVTTGWSGYNYRSDGNNYKIINNATGPDSWPASNEQFYDPARPNAAWMVTNNGGATSAW